MVPNKLTGHCKRIKIDNNAETAAERCRDKRETVPFLDSAEVESHLSVGESLLVEIAAVASDERGHVVA